MLKLLPLNPLMRALLLFATMAGVVATLAYVLQPALVPLIISFVLYALLQPVSRALLRTGFSPLAAIATVLLGLIAIIAIAIVLIFPVVLEQAEQFQNELPVLWNHFAARIEAMASSASANLGLTIDMGELTGQWFARIQEKAAPVLMTSAGLVVRFGVVLILVPLITFFLLRDFRTFSRQMLNWLPNSGFELGWLIYHRVGRQLQKYVRGVIIQSVIVAVVTSTGFLLIGLDLALLLGSLAGILNLIPYVGPLVAMVLPLVMVVGSGGFQAWMVVAVIGVVLLAQIIDNVVVIPAVIASTVDLHPLIVLLGVVVFGFLFGLIGMLVAIPLLATSKIILTGLIYGLEGQVSPQIQPACK